MTERTKLDRAQYAEALDEPGRACGRSGGKKSLSAEVRNILERSGRVLAGEHLPAEVQRVVEGLLAHWP
jgi:hypothetical protein